MSGPPAFQPNTFQQNAFQSGVQVIASAYTLASPEFTAPTLHFNYHLSAPAYALASPVFATPAPTKIPLTIYAFWTGSPAFVKPGPLKFNYHFTAAAYAIGSPAFALPHITSGANYNPVHANPYSLASPTSVHPPLQQVQHVPVNAYALGSPAFSTPAIEQNYRFFANFYDVASPSFAAPRMVYHYGLAATTLTVGGLYWTPVGPVEVQYLLRVNAYWLDHPTFGFPRLQTAAVAPGWPPTYLSQVEEATNLLIGFINALLKSVPNYNSPAANQFLQLASRLRGNADTAIRGNTLGTQLGTVMLAADAAGSTYLGVDAARQYLMGYTGSVSALTQIVMRSALVMTLALESKVISRMTFVSKEDAYTMITAVKAAFDDAKSVGIDTIDAPVYQTLITMGGAIMNHLATTALQLPRYISYHSAFPMPTLYLANRIYQDASRFIEIEQENGIIHPAFAPMNLRVLSDAGILPHQ